MVLNSQQFAEVLGFLRRDHSTLGSEKRRAVRLDLNCTLGVVPVVNGGCGHQATVLTRDISMDGIGLLCGIPLHKGQHLIVLLPRSESQTLFLQSEVVYSETVADGMFTVGCQFLRVLPQQAADKLLKPKSAELAPSRQSVLT